MDETKLRYFITVAKYRSFSKAAQELHVVQPTVSRQITLLEEALGPPLFYRNTHTVELTPAGERLYSSASFMLRQYQSIRDSAQNLMLETEHLVRAACGPVEFVLLEPLARLYRQVDPEIKFSMIKGMYDRMARSLQSGASHLLITTRTAALTMSECPRHSLGTHRWKAVTHRDSDFWHLPPEAQRTLRGQMIVRCSEPTFDPAYHWLQSRPLAHRGIVTASAFSMICLQANLGAVALMPEYAEPWLPASLRMEQVFPDPPEVESVLIFNPDRASESEHRFFEYIRDNYKP